MGAAKQRQVATSRLLEHPENRFCCFCGETANTVDHFPPRAMFIEKGWPEGYAYPACPTCNSAKRKDEQSLLLLTQLMTFDGSPEQSGFTKALSGVRNNNPRLLEELSTASAVSSKRYLRQRFGSAEAVNKLGFTGWAAVSFGPETERLLGRFCLWFGQTAFFKHCGKRLEGELIWANLPAETLYRDEMSQILANLVGTPVMLRNGKDISDQFNYRYFAGEDILIAIFHFGRRPQMVFIILAAPFGVIGDVKELGDFWRKSGPVGNKPVEPT